MPCTRLKYTNTYGEVFYFRRAAELRPGQLAIVLTTPRRDRAACFETTPEAVELLQKVGDPPGWSVEVEDSIAPSIVDS